MRLDGRIPDIVMVPTTGMHQGQAMAMMRNARRIDASVRPLTIAGGSHAVYEPAFLSSTPTRSFPAARTLP